MQLCFVISLQFVQHYYRIQIRKRAKVTRNDKTVCQKLIKMKTTTAQDGDGVGGGGGEIASTWDKLNEMIITSDATVMTHFLTMDI